MTYIELRQARDLESVSVGEVMGGVMRLATEGGLTKSTRPDEPFNDVAPERVLELRKMPYEEYLQTPEWLHIKAVMKRHVPACELCGQRALWLDVHHLTYERRGQEWGSDVLGLCRMCHLMAHTRLAAL